MRARCELPVEIYATGQLSYTTRFPEYIAVRSIIPASMGYAVLRHFHAPAATTMVATLSLRKQRGLPEDLHSKNGIVL